MYFHIIQKIHLKKKLQLAFVLTDEHWRAEIATMHVVGSFYH